MAFAAVAALFAAALLYSSFGANPSGLRDALAAYGHAAERFLGPSAGPTGHEKPWTYYAMLFGWKREGGLVCEVLDDSAALPRLRHAGDEDERGRGLQVVSQLAQHWGARRTPSGPA